MQDEEREAEHRERVLGAQFTVVEVDVELLGEAVHASTVSSRLVGSI